MDSLLHLIFSLMPALLKNLCSLALWKSAHLKFIKHRPEEFLLIKQQFPGPDLCAPQQSSERPGPPLCRLACLLMAGWSPPFPTYTPLLVLNPKPFSWRYSHLGYLRPLGAYPEAQDSFSARYLCEGFFMPLIYCFDPSFEGITVFVSVTWFKFLNRNASLFYSICLSFSTFINAMSFEDCY